MKKMTTKQLVLSGLIAALYVVLTAGLPILSYYGVQFRFAEALVLLAYFNPVFIPAVTVGTFIANFIGPFGLVDALAGASVSLVAMLMMVQTKKLMGDNLTAMVTSTVWPIVLNALYVPALLIALIPDFPDGFWLVAGQVAIGQFAVISVFGVVLFKGLEKNKNFSELVK